MRQSRIVLLMLQKSGIHQLVGVGNLWISEPSIVLTLLDEDSKLFFSIGEIHGSTWVDVPSIEMKLWMNELRDSFCS